jgi:hypothetical protein
MTKCRLTSAHLVFGLMTFVCTATAAPPSPEVNRHCVVRLEAAGSDVSQLATSTEPECYPTFRDATFFATGGRVLLPSKQPFSVQLEILDQELKARQEELSADGPVVVAIDYEHINYGGASLFWIADGPCDPSHSPTPPGWQSPSMPSGWNDRLSSTRAYWDCSRNILFEHSNYGGGHVICRPDCSSVGWMNDRTSSRRFQHTCSGIAWGWQGCRGTGCHVCAELVANYPCYFQNHPNCISNSTCIQPYGRCSDNCPAPTQADTCQPGPVCPNGLCESGEDSWNCPQDCGEPGGSCNFDGFCDVFGGECAANCPQDCTSGEFCQ